MFNKDDFDFKIDKKSYKKEYKDLSLKFLDLARRCREHKIPIFIIVDGLDASGKGIQINKLVEPLDRQNFKVHQIDASSTDENERPFLYRFFTKIPKNDSIVILDGSWYRRVTIDKFNDKYSSEEVKYHFKEIETLERQLVDSKMCLIKLYLHIDEEEQSKRLKELESSEHTSWRISKDDLNRNKKYDEYLEIVKESIKKTNFDFCNWNIVHTNDRKTGTISILEVVNKYLEDALNNYRDEVIEDTPIHEEVEDILARVDLDKHLDKDEYQAKLEVLQKRLAYLQVEVHRKKIPVVLAFEGWDAGGKGGAIKRLTAKMDPRGYAVYSTQAPTKVEHEYHYLWRFWKNVPKNGFISIFDRTWYGRVMVERVEGFCSVADWKRAYSEINAMEASFIDGGAVVLKFWLHIDKQEQLLRFEARQNNPLKQWKISDEDWRNRKKWDQHKDAVNEMLMKTNMPQAPWIIVEANCKMYARIKVLETVINALEKRLFEEKDSD